MQVNPKLDKLLVSYLEGDGSIGLVLSGKINDERATFQDLILFFVADKFIEATRDSLSITPTDVRRAMNVFVSESWSVPSGGSVEIQKVKFLRNHNYPEHDEMFMDHFFPDWRMNRVK